METKRFVVSFVHVILTRQTCGQRSNRAAESKRRALGNYLSERICYIFLMSKCRGDRDLGLCKTSVLAFGEPQRSGKIRFFLRRNTFFPEILPCRCGSCLIGPVNLVRKLQGTCLFRRMDLPNLLNLVRKSKKFTNLWRRILARPTSNYQAWLAFRRFQAAFGQLQPFHRERRGCSTIFPGIDRGLALLLPLCVPLSLHPVAIFPERDSAAATW